MSTTTTVRATGPVSPERVWTLLASPACWPAWAPHMRHVAAVAGVEAPSAVTVGQELRIHTVAPLVRIPVTVTAVEDGVSWDMTARLPAGTMQSRHHLDSTQEGSAVVVTLTWRGPRLLGRVILAAYQPVARYSVRRLLALAGDDQIAPTTP